MGFFDFFTKKRVKNITSINTTSENQTLSNKQKESIYDFFTINFDNIPDNSFVKGNLEINAANVPFQSFHKKLDKKECGIFDKLEIRIIGSSSKNYIFYTDPTTADIKQVKNLVNSIYTLYGKDSMGMGCFTNEDENDYYNDFFDKRWASPQDKEPVAISKDSESLSIVIWGINKKQNQQSKTNTRKEEINAIFNMFHEMPIKGINYADKGKIKVGKNILGKIISISDNEYDRYAIEVVSNDVKYGYLPANNSDLHKLLIDKYGGEMEVTIDVTQEFDSIENRKYFVGTAMLYDKNSHFDNIKLQGKTSWRN